MNQKLSYNELITIPSFDDRIKYLELHDFNNQSPRDINQRLYQSKQWKNTRRKIIARDLGYDLAMPGVSILGRALIHHINPINAEDILTWNIDKIFNPNNLVLVSYDTHGKIHFSKSNQEGLKERAPGDTIMW